MAIYLLLLACTGAPEDSGLPVDTDPPVEDTDDDFSCDTPEIRVNGGDPATVGETWEVFMWCGDVLMHGAMHMAITPPEMGTIEDFRLTFNQAGSGELDVQIGSIRASRPVEVVE